MALATSLARTIISSRYARAIPAAITSLNAACMNFWNTAGELQSQKKSVLQI